MFNSSKETLRKIYCLLFFCIEVFKEILHYFRPNANFSRKSQKCLAAAGICRGEDNLLTLKKKAAIIYSMKNYYSTIDKVVLTFSDIQIDSDGFEFLEAYFELPSDGGFFYSKWSLPEFKCSNSYGFSEDDILRQETYLRNNVLLLWEIAKENADKKSA